MRARRFIEIMWLWENEHPFSPRSQAHKKNESELVKVMIHVVKINQAL